MGDPLSTIPLSALKPSKRNVRKTGRTADIEALAASIEVHGLLQNLTVREVAGAGRARYEVIAGGRRLAALKLLVRRKRLAKDTTVPCRVLAEVEAADTELSLAENVFRVPLHPADQYEAFSNLRAEGLGPEAIAARFGVTPGVVLQRLKLAAVSPRLMTAYRNDDMTLDQLTAFAISDDRGAQERVWSDDPRKERPAHAIRRELTRSLVDANDRRARFVGADAYETAGGTILRDLFQPDGEGYFTDAALLDRLASEKLIEEARAVEAEGWRWVEVRPEMDYEYLARFGRVPPDIEGRSEEDRRRLEEAGAAYDALVSELEDEVPAETTAKLDALEAEIGTLSAYRERWDDDARARCGVLVTLGHDGELVIARGLLKSASSTAAKKKPKARRNGKSDLPDPLRETLSAHRTAALRLELSRNPHLAFLALLHALVLRTFYGSGHSTCVDIRPVLVQFGPAHEELKESPAVKAFAEERQRLSEELPPPEDLWTYLYGCDRDANLARLAHCTASSVTALWRRNETGNEARLAQADALASALKLNMAAWWQPTRVSYLDHVTKGGILDAVSEGISKQAAENIAALKKGPMAARAEELLAKTRWLPEPLRTANLPEVDTA